MLLSLANIFIRFRCCGWLCSHCFRNIFHLHFFNGTKFNFSCTVHSLAAESTEESMWCQSADVAQQQIKISLIYSKLWWFGERTCWKMLISLQWHVNWSLTTWRCSSPRSWRMRAVGWIFIGNAINFTSSGSMNLKNNSDWKSFACAQN